MWDLILVWRIRWFGRGKMEKYGEREDGEEWILRGYRGVVQRGYVRSVI